MKADTSLFWVEVTKDYVYFRDGPNMPEPIVGTLYYGFFGRSGCSRKEFARWSGITFPAGLGVYGLKCPLAIVERYRAVEEKSYVAAEKTTRKLVRV